MGGQSERDQYFCGEAAVVELPLLFLCFLHLKNLNQPSVMKLTNLFQVSTVTIS